MSSGTAVVTGASAGLGAIYADRLARRGYDLVLAARDEGRLAARAERLRAEAGVRVEVLRTDLTRSGDTEALAARIAGPDVTLLVNNAGMSLTGDTMTAAEDEIERLIALNIAAPTRLAIAAAKAFVARGGGTIVNIASVLALTHEIGEGVYNGSKSYLLTFGRALAREIAGKGVHIQTVLPGATRTEIWERSGKDVDAFPAEMVMSADDLVDAALLGLDRGEAVTIPPLADEAQWTSFDHARAAMVPQLSKREPAPRYRATAAD